MRSGTARSSGMAFPVIQHDSYLWHCPISSAKRIPVVRGRPYGGSRPRHLKANSNASDDWSSRYDDCGTRGSDGIDADQCRLWSAWP